jgi:uncharacterized protein YqeY
MSSDVSLKGKLQRDLNGAIKSRNTVVAETIRMVLSAITNEEVAGKEKRELSDAEVITVLTREAKKRREAAEAFENGGRADRAAAERAEGEVIASYLPEQLSEDEIKKLIAETVAAVGAAGPSDMGKVMGSLKGKVAGKADGALVSSLVKEALNK